MKPKKKKTTGVGIEPTNPLQHVPAHRKKQTQKEEDTGISDSSFLVYPAHKRVMGIEPTTSSLEGWRSAN